MQNAQRLESLRVNMDKLFDNPASKSHFAYIHNLREYKNPRIIGKLIQTFNINQYGSNYPKQVYDPHSWEKKQKSCFDSMNKEMAEQKERER